MLVEAWASLIRFVHMQDSESAYTHAGDPVDVMALFRPGEYLRVLRKDYLKPMLTRAKRHKFQGVCDNSKPTGELRRNSKLKGKLSKRVHDSVPPVRVWCSGVSGVGEARRGHAHDRGAQGRVALLVGGARVQQPRAGQEVGSHAQTGAHPRCWLTSCTGITV